MNTSLHCEFARSFPQSANRCLVVRPIVVRFLLACAALAPLSFASAADEPGHSGESEHEYTISANRLKTPLIRQGNSVTIITAEQIESSKQTQLIEVLKTVPGLDIVQSGGLGGNAAIFLRGANSEHTLVLVDGIEINNPISNSRSFNFADISLDNVERIEVIRGPQSTVYGSDALGGVINIITKRGGGDFAGSVEAQAGSYSTFIEKASASGGLDGMRYSIGASREDSDSISSAGAAYGNTEDDSYQNTSVASRIGLDPLEQFSTDLIFRYNSSRTDLDNTGGFGGDDPNRLLENQQLFTRAEARTSFLDGTFNQRAGLSYTSHDLEDSNDPDAAHPLDRLRSNFTGELVKFDIQSDFKAGEYNTVVVGFETEHEQGSSYLSSDSAFGPFDTSFGE
ncbi:MAG: TonB-dependent receptor, partial [Deltaproteobacteria bacterium]|nr:TonB-dependent receptor [Deltaproteobacteria bacterium]